MCCIEEKVGVTGVVQRGEPAHVNVGLRPGLDRVAPWFGMDGGAGNGTDDIPLLKTALCLQPARTILAEDFEKT
jgi:hypothetical protein